MTTLKRKLHLHKFGAFPQNCAQGKQSRKLYIFVLLFTLGLAIVFMQKRQFFDNKALAAEAKGCWTYNKLCNTACQYQATPTIKGYPATCTSKNPHSCTLITKKNLPTSKTPCDPNGSGTCFLPTSKVEANVTLCSRKNGKGCVSYPQVTNTTAACTFLPYAPQGGPITPAGMDADEVAPPALTDNFDEVKVISLAYYPIKNGYLDRSIVDNSFKEYNMSLREVRGKVATLNQGLEATLEKGTRYHGYADPASAPSLDYVLTEQREMLQDLPISTKRHPNYTGLYLTDYRQIIKENNLCPLIEKQGIKEVWIWGYTGIGKAGWESNFQSIWGDISNSDQDTKDLPSCGHSYTVYEYNYGREVSEATEDHIHQFEAIFKSVDQNIFWNEYVGYDITRTDLLNKEKRCGWAHFPPNAEWEKDWSNLTMVETDCLNWKPGGGTTSLINCQQWGCNSKDYFIFWMQNIPSGWWNFIADFDTAKRNHQTLLPYTFK